MHCRETPDHSLAYIILVTNYFKNAMICQTGTSMYVYAEFNLFTYKNLCQTALIPIQLIKRISIQLIVKTKNVIQKMAKLTKINKLINIILKATKKKLSIIMKNSKLKVVAICLMMNLKMIVVVTMILVNNLLPLK